MARLKLGCSLFLFCVWKAAHTLTGHLTSAVMTEANTCSIENSTNGSSTRAKQHWNNPFFFLFCFFPSEMSAAGSAHDIFISTLHVSFNVCVLASKWNGAARCTLQSLCSRFSPRVRSHACVLSPNGPEELEMRSFLHNSTWLHEQHEETPNLNTGTHSKSWQRCPCSCSGFYYRLRVGLSNEKRAWLTMQKHSILLQNCKAAPQENRMMDRKKEDGEGKITCWRKKLKPGDIFTCRLLGFFEANSGVIARFVLFTWAGANEPLVCVFLCQVSWINSSHILVLILVSHPIISSLAVASFSPLAVPVCSVAINESTGYWRKLNCITSHFQTGDVNLMHCQTEVFRAARMKSYGRNMLGFSMQRRQKQLLSKELLSGLSHLNAVQQSYREKSIAGEAQAPISPLTAHSFVQKALQQQDPAVFCSLLYLDWNILLSCFCYRQCYHSFQWHEHNNFRNALSWFSKMRSTLFNNK